MLSKMLKIMYYESKVNKGSIGKLKLSRQLKIK